MGSVRTSVAAVLWLIDTVTEKWVTRTEIGIQVAQRSKILWKAANCAVILAQAGVHRVDVFLSGGIYCDVQLHLDLPENGKPLTRYIWMQPAAGYPFAGGMTVIRGRCTDQKPGSALFAARLGNNTKYKLMETTAAGDDHILLWGYDGIAQERIIMLCGNGESECVTLMEPAEDLAHGYRIKGRMDKIFHKGSTQIYMVTRILTDSDGSFILAYRHKENEREKIRFWRDGMIAAELDIGKDREYFVEV